MKPSYRDKKKLHHHLLKCRKQPVGYNVFMRLRHVCMNYVLQVPDTIISEWDRIEFIENHDQLTLQVYRGTAAPSYVYLTRAPKKMKLEQLVENWKAFRFFDPYKQKMVSPLPRSLPARFNQTESNHQ